MLVSDQIDQVRPYRAKIAECHALCNASDDPLMQAVYRAMASEFEERAGPEARQAVAPQVAARQALAPSPPRAFLPRLVSQAR
jgi:hypothetical protein